MRFACACASLALHSLDMDLLLTGGAEVAAKELDRLVRALVEELERSVPSALRGEEGATRVYVRAWRGLSRHYLQLAHDVLPDAVLETEKGDTLIVDIKRSVSPIATTLLDYLAVEAPFSPWVTHFGAGRGVAVFLLSEVRQAIPGLDPIPLPKGASGLAHWDVNEGDFARFARLVWQELQGEESLLTHIARVFQLTVTDLANLFGVSRQAVSQWLEEDIPSSRQPKALTVAHIADLLERNLSSSRIPAIARSPAPAYGGGSMVDMIAADRHEELLDIVRESFDWAVTG